jgi:hypothetical protein
MMLRAFLKLVGPRTADVALEDMIWVTATLVRRAQLRRRKRKIKAIARSPENRQLPCAIGSSRRSRSDPPNSVGEELASVVAVSAQSPSIPNHAIVNK